MTNEKNATSLIITCNIKRQKYILNSYSLIADIIKQKKKKDSQFSEVTNFVILFHFDLRCNKKNAWS